MRRNDTFEIDGYSGSSFANVVLINFLNDHSFLNLVLAVQVTGTTYFCQIITANVVLVRHGPLERLGGGEGEFSSCRNFFV